jgi:hypothetical protein
MTTENRKSPRGQSQPKQNCEETGFGSVSSDHYNNRPYAVLFLVTENTDIESMVLENNEFWQLMDRAHKEGGKKGFTKLEELSE